jgi:hypothetical protein
LFAAMLARAPALMGEGMVGEDPAPQAGTAASR